MFDTSREIVGGHESHLQDKTKRAGREKFAGQGQLECNWHRHLQVLQSFLITHCPVDGELLKHEQSSARHTGRLISAQAKCDTKSQLALLALPLWAIRTRHTQCFPVLGLV